MRPTSPFQAHDITLTITPITEAMSYHIGFEMPQLDSSKSTRMHMSFKASNDELSERCPEYFDDTAHAYIEFALPATGYGEKSDTAEGFLRSVINSIVAYRDAFNAEQDMLQDKHPRHTRCSPALIMTDKEQDVSTFLLMEFIKRMTPERKAFSIDEMPLIDDYRFVYYSTEKWLYSALRGSNYHTLFESQGCEGELFYSAPMFDSVDEIIDFLTAKLKVLTNLSKDTNLVTGR
tara:strand:+ start:1085 stop:1786 length:702 start_codon:yes stop_codon:yes gene_type:complete